MPTISKSRKWQEIALVLLVFFVHGGAPAPHVNETCYVTKAKHYWNPDWCAGDLFLDSADAHLVFYWTIGWLTKFFSLTTTAWIGRVAAWTGLAWAWQRLSSRVVAAPYASVLSAAWMVWMVGNMNFAGEWVVGGVEGKCFAYACVFAALAELVSNHWNRTWLWLGLASAFHVLVGGWSAIAVGLVWLVRRSEERPQLRTMLPSLLITAVLALPGILPALQLTSGVTPEESREASQIYVFDRLPHHLAPLTEPSEQLLMRTLRFSVPLVVFLVLWRLAQPNGSDQQGLATICRFAAIAFLLSVFGLLWEVAFWNHPQLAAPALKYYWFRLADVAVPVAAALLICHWLVRVLREKSKLVTWVLAFAVLLPTGHLVSVSVARWQDGTPPADRKMFDPGAWREACFWIRDNTSEDANFLVPRASQTFSWYTGRRNVVTWKDVPQDARALLLWSDRYYDVFWHVDIFNQYVPYSSLGWQGSERIRDLAAKYDVDYVVTRDYPPLQLPVVYRNPWYTVYSIEAEPERSDQ